MTRLAIVLTYDIPEPEVVPELVRAIDPPCLPYFDGEVRIVIDSDVNDLIRFLDMGEV